MGRVFFTLPRTDPRNPENWRYCSATSVQGTYRNLAATSAHCVYDTKTDTLYDNWVFIPSFWDGDTAWTGSATTSAARASLEQEHQAERVLVRLPGGRAPRRRQPYSGRTMKWCYGTTRPMPESAKHDLQEHVGVTCAFTAGASGGPLLLGHTSASRTGHLVGVNSVAWDTDGNDRYDHISSPYFNGDTYKVYKAAANRRTGNMPR